MKTDFRKTMICVGLGIIMIFVTTFLAIGLLKPYTAIYQYVWFIFLAITTSLVNFNNTIVNKYCNNKKIELRKMLKEFFLQRGIYICIAHGALIVVSFFTNGGAGNYTKIINTSVFGLYQDIYNFVLTILITISFLVFQYKNAEDFWKKMI